MRRTLGLITALLLAAPAVIWTQGNPDRPFRFQGRNWVNQEAFIASGARCATRDLTPERRDQVDQEIAAHLNKGGGAPTVTGGVIDVWFHVITSTSGQGDVLDQQINSQINVLNAAFANGGWSFQLVGVDRTDKQCLVCDGARHDGGARRESSAPTGNGGRLEHLHGEPRRRAARLGDVPIELRRRSHCRMASSILFSSLPGRLGRAVQPRRHGDARSRPLDGPVPHVPGRMQQQERSHRRHSRQNAARPSDARSAAIRASAPDSIRLRTSWTTPTTRACSSSRRDRTSGWTRSSARTGSARSNASSGSDSAAG